MLRCCGQPFVRRAKTASVVNNIALVNTFIISPFRSKDMESKSIVEIHFSRYSLPYFLISAMLNSISHFPAPPQTDVRGPGNQVGQYNVVLFKCEGRRLARPSGPKRI